MPPVTTVLKSSRFTYRVKRSTSAREEHVDLTHLGDGLRSEFFHVVVVADLNKLAGYAIGSLADYIAMLALSQTEAFYACQELPSITNLMSVGSDTSSKTNAISDVFERSLQNESRDHPPIAARRHRLSDEAVSERQSPVICSRRASKARSVARRVDICLVRQQNWGGISLLSCPR
jgi:hypothetical protein